MSTINHRGSQGRRQQQQYNNFSVTPPSFSPPNSGTSSNSPSTSSVSSSPLAVLKNALQPAAMGVLLGQGWHVYNEGWATWTKEGLFVSSIGVAVGLLLGIEAGRRRAELRGQCFWLACLVTGGLAAIAQLRLRLRHKQGGALAVNAYLSSLVLGTSLPHVATYLTSDLRPGKLLPCALMMLMTEAICANEQVPLLQTTTFLLLALGGVLGLASGASGSPGSATPLLQGLGASLGSNDDSSARRKKVGSKAPLPGPGLKGGKGMRPPDPLEPFNPTTSTSKKRYAPKFLLSRREVTVGSPPPSTLKSLGLSARLGEMRKKDRDRRSTPNPGLQKGVPDIESEVQEGVQDDRGADSTQASPEKVQTLIGQADETDQDQNEFSDVKAVSEQQMLSPDPKDDQSVLSTSLRASAEEFIPPTTSSLVNGPTSLEVPLTRSALRADATAFCPIVCPSQEYSYDSHGYSGDMILQHQDHSHGSAAIFGGADGWHGGGEGDAYQHHLGTDNFSGDYGEQGHWDSFGDFNHHYSNMGWTEDGSDHYGYEAVPDVPSPPYDVPGPGSSGSLSHHGTGRVPVQSDITLRNSKRKKPGEEVFSLVPEGSGPEGTGRASELRGRQNEDSTPISRTLMVTGFGLNRKFNEDDVAGLFGAEASVSKVSMVGYWEEKGSREALVEFASKATAQEALGSFPGAATVSEEEKSALSIAFATPTNAGVPTQIRSSSSLPSQSGSISNGGLPAGGERKPPFLGTSRDGDISRRRRRESQGNRSAATDEKCCWAYIDPNGEVQFGFSSEDMRQWSSMGYFKNSQKCALIRSTSKAAEAPPLSEFYPLDEWFPQRNTRF
eukprot:CAMPEP_0206533916 /NCGR_PEP_ID=MMETSP0325_2-20121206/5245_1 /ASSEMBLY_ACC=CAM_ASM_000347 /TAXON_ID=2866 /ORGANISM="Crypthecodinium cohnii, Strain Seligo" /LENGTH=837 /DNA_ID=CAMNT_0054030641 /DNA_START=492 /DNA_END=3002 /DNA_ORIENTATION=-